MRKLLAVSSYWSKFRYTTLSIDQIEGGHPLRYKHYLISKLYSANPTHFTSVLRLPRRKKSCLDKSSGLEGSQLVSKGCHPDAEAGVSGSSDPTDSNCDGGQLGDHGEFTLVHLKPGGVFPPQSGLMTQGGRSRKDKDDFDQVTRAVTVVRISCYGRRHSRSRTTVFLVWRGPRRRAWFCTRCDLARSSYARPSGPRRIVLFHGHSHRFRFSIVGFPPPL